MTDVSISLPAKRRRGRPRKDVNLSRQGNLQSPQNSTHTNHTQCAGTIYPTPNGLKNNTHQELNTNPKDATTVDFMVGSMIYGVIEGSFDAGYLISVRIANNDTPFRGVVFQPQKFIPITPAIDVAPQATMYQRREITVPLSSDCSPRPPQKVTMQSVPTSKQTVLRPVLPFSAPPYFSNQSAFMLPDAMMLRTNSFPQLGGKNAIPGIPKVGANQQSPPVHPTDEVMQAFEVTPTSNQKPQVHGPSTFTRHNFMEDVCGPAFDIQQGEMIRREMEHRRQFVHELQEPQHQDIKTDLHPTDMYYNDLRGQDVNFHHDLFTDQSQPNSTRLGPDFHQGDIVDSLSKSPNLKLDLSSSVHEKNSETILQTSYLIHNEMKSPDLGYHQALVAGNPLLLPPEFTSEHLEFMLEKNQSLPNSKTRQETSTEGVSSPSGPYKLELATPQSTINTRPGEQTNSSAGCITDMDFVLSDVVQPTEYHEHQGDLSETKHR